MRFVHDYLVAIPRHNAWQSVLKGVPALMTTLFEVSDMCGYHGRGFGLVV
jgi:hypothetical protein